MTDLSRSPTKKADKMHALKEFQKESHEEHAPDSVRDSEMGSEMVDVSARKSNAGADLATPAKGTDDKLMAQDEIDYAPIPDKTQQYDIEPKEEKGDDDGGDDRSNHSFDEDDNLEDDHVKKFDTLRVKAGLSW